MTEDCTSLFVNYFRCSWNGKVVSIVVTRTSITALIALWSDHGPWMFITRIDNRHLLKV